MKKISLVLLCFALYVSALAQNSFPTSNAIWNESIDFNGVTHEMLFGLLGDTTINNTTYHKLYRLSDTLLIAENLRHYVGAFRNEGEKVFFKPAHWEYPDILLYDFGIEVGDTIWHNAAFAYSPDIVDYYYFTFEHIEHYNYSTFFMDGGIINDRRAYYMKTRLSLPYYMWPLSIPLPWFEGLGSYGGLFLPLLCDVMIPMPLYGKVVSFNLNCFKHNDTVKYLNNTNCHKCFCPREEISIPDYKIDTDFISVYPNPTTGELRITNYDSRFTNYELQLYDVIGREIFSEKMIGNRTHTIDISHLQSGMYFLKIDNQRIRIIKN